MRWCVLIVAVGAAATARADVQVPHDFDWREYDRRERVIRRSTCRRIPPAGSVGLLLSRVGKRWDVSKVQKWWLRWQALEANKKTNWLERHERQWELAQDFPRVYANPLHT